MSYFETRKRWVGKTEGYGGGFMSILVGNLGTSNQSWHKTISCWFGESNIDNIVTILNPMINMNPQQKKMGPQQLPIKTTLIDDYGLPILNNKRLKTNKIAVSLLWS